MPSKLQRSTYKHNIIGCLRTFELALERLKTEIVSEENTKILVHLENLCQKRIDETDTFFNLLEESKDEHVLS